MQYHVKAPNGQDYTIDGPEGASDADVIAQVKKAYPGDFGTVDTTPNGDSFADRHPYLDTAWDTVRGVATNLKRGAIETAGALGTGEELVNTGLDWLTNKAADITGADWLRPPEGVAPPHSFWRPEDIEKTTGTTYYDPHTNIGRYAGAIAEQVPAMALPGASTAVRGSKLTTNLLRGAGQRAAGAAGAGIASEAAGDITDDNPLARGIAGAVGGFAGGFAGAEKLRREQRAALASSEQAAKQAYDYLANSTHPISGLEFEMLGATAELDLHQQAFREGTAPQTYKIMRDELRAPPGGQSQLTPSGALTTTYPGQVVRRVADLVGTHEALGRIKPGVNVSHTDWQAAQEVRAHIRNFLESLPNKQIGQAHKDAVGNWAAHAKEKDVLDAIENAENRAGSTGRGLNYQNVIRQEILKVLKRRVQRGGLTPEEETSMRRIVRGTNIENIARVASSWAPWDLHRGLAAIAAGGVTGHWMVGAGLAGVGATAQHLAKVLNKRDLDILLTTIRERAPTNQYIGGRNRAARARAQMMTGQTMRRGALIGASGGDRSEDDAEPEASNLEDTVGNLGRFASRFNPISSAQAGELPPDDFAAHGKVSPAEALDPMPGSAGLAGRTAQLKSGLEAGKSFAQLAREMGTTRNAVAGLASRAGLKASRTVKHTDEGLAALRESGKATGGLASHPTGWTRGPRPIPQVRAPALPLSVREQIMREQRYGTGRPTPSLPQFNLPPVPEEESMLTPEEVLENPQAA